MSAAERATQSTSRNVLQRPDTNGIAVPYRWQVYLACVVLALGCNYILGKDMAWDTLNYHLYLGFSALNDRFGQDYFAAGSLTYLNPYAYVPFYVMVRAGLPALVICSAFAVAHSFILWLSFELGVAVSPSKDAATRSLAGICAVALTFMNPILMQQLGSCFADITTAELALGGWLLLASAVLEPRDSKVVYAGLILGAASALKLSNALAAFSAFAMLAFLPLTWRDKIRQTLLYCVSLGIGFAVVAAPWGYRLARRFGNPLFPMFNNVFRSPELPTEASGNASRFIPDSFSDALWRPFAMVDPYQMIHEELSAPDPRYAILILLLFVFAARWAWRRLPKRSPSPINLQKDNTARILISLGCGLTLNWVLWLSVSGNSRYALTMACIASAVLVGLLFRLFRAQPKARNYILVAILSTQAIQLYMGAEYRWNGVAWGGQWFNLSIPEKLKTEPYLYLTLGTLSNSFLAPFLAPGSSLINVAGGYTLDPDGVSGARVRELIHRYSPNVRVVYLTTKPSESQPRAFLPEAEATMQGYGLRPDMADCATITVHGLPPEVEIRLQTSMPQAPQDRENTYVETCRVVPDHTDRSVVLARLRAVDLIFDRLEDACPKLFRPRRLITVHYGDVWRRLYGATDIVAWVSHGRVKFSDQIRPHGLVDLGSEADWGNAPLRLECGKHDGVFYAHVLPSNL
jgi:hypothetical protein